MASSNQIVSDIFDVEVPETTSSDDSVVPSTTLHKMYVELMRNFKELKHENDDLKQKIAYFMDENDTLYEDIEELKKKHAAEKERMRTHSNHNALLASKRATEIKKLKEEKKELQKMYDESIGKKKSPVVKKLKKELDRAYKQERKDMDEIDELKMENKNFRKRNIELTEDRNMLRQIVVDLRSIVCRQHEELEMWQDCYEESWNYEEE